MSDPSSSRRSRASSRVRGSVNALRTRFESMGLSSGEQSRSPSSPTHPRAMGLTGDGRVTAPQQIASSRSESTALTATARPCTPPQAPSELECPPAPHKPQTINKRLSASYSDDADILLDRRAATTMNAPEPLNVASLRRRNISGESGTQSPLRNSIVFEEAIEANAVLSSWDAPMQEIYQFLGSPSSSNCDDGKSDMMEDLMAKVEEAIRDFSPPRALAPVREDSPERKKRRAGH
ncbi:hypothetical protein BJ170DRAFT_678244 [Xylariales sp. AK1849]|nr:hypothetical protein BJ170DRAFT_678244 [Xylariales sp. AK1849]